MIRILNDSEDKTLVVQASGKLTTRDYEETFIPMLDGLIGRYGRIRVVFYLDESFEGWELGAAWDDAKFGLKHKNDFERIAMVGGPRWVSWIATLSSHFVHGALRMFDKNELHQAIAWAKQGAEIPAGR